MCPWKGAGHHLPEGWYLLTSGTKQLLTGPAASSGTMEEQTQLWWCPAGWHPHLVAGAGVVWAREWSVPVDRHRDWICPCTYKFSMTLWHVIFSTWWQIRWWGDWLARPRQCQVSVRPWPWFQNTGKSFLTLISYDVFTRSRSSTKEEVQKKCFLGKLFYFKVFKDIIKTWFAFQWKGSKPENLFVRLILGLLNKKSNLEVNALNQKWEWNY